MALKSLDTDNLNYEQKIKQYKRKRTAVIILIVLALAGIFLFLINKIFVKNYNSYEVISSAERTDSNTVIYARYGKNLLKYSRDGASALDGISGQLWNGSYDMKSPLADVCGEYTVIADIGNKDFALFDGKENMKLISLNNTIVAAKVAKQGVVAVIMENGDMYEIKVYDPFRTGDEAIIEFGIPVKENGFVIGFDLSDDGTRLVISVLKVENGSAHSELVSYNFSDVSESTNYRLDGGILKYKDSKTLIAKVEFINNNTIAVYGDNTIDLYSMKVGPQEIASIPLETEVRSIFSNEKYVGFVADNHELDGRYKLKLYNISGQKVLEQAIDYDYNQIIMGSEEIIFLNDSQCTILKTNGRVKFQGTFDKKVSFIMPIDNFNKYYIVNETSIEKIKLVEDK